MKKYTHEGTGQPERRCSFIHTRRAIHPIRKNERRP
jgi:hypothetical protein